MPAQGRTPQKCKCGQELFVEEIQSDEGQTLNRFIPCKCGSSDVIVIEPGSIIGGFTPSLMNVWGPPKHI
jgi:hypothetical protein